MAIGTVRLAHGRLGAVVRGRGYGLRLADAHEFDGDRVGLGQAARDGWPGGGIAVGEYLAADHSLDERLGAWLPGNAIEIMSGKNDVQRPLTVWRTPDHIKVLDQDVAGAAKQQAGKADLVAAELAKLHRHLLAPLGVPSRPATLGLALASYRAARSHWEQRLRCQVSRAAEQAVSPVLR